MFENLQEGLFKNTVKMSVILFASALVLALILGIILSSLNNLDRLDNLLETKYASLPSVLLDRNGEVITEYYSDEKRDLITLDRIPEFFLQGLILWEDESFYHHHGFNPWAIFRASLGNFIGRPISGASTLTQQLSRTIFLTTKFSFLRKITEIWYAIQLEKKYTKNEILTLYLNNVPLGSGVNGVQAAARFYFDKNINEITPSEAASIITMISNPTYYSFIRFPAHHKKKQKEVLKRMVRGGVITELESSTSFNEFWLQWQSRSESARGAFFNREDKAPYFSDWVLNEISSKLPNVNVFRDGLIIHSTLDLKFNKLAEGMMVEIIEKQQKKFEAEQARNYALIQNYFIDSVALMGETFSLTNVNVDRNRSVKRCFVDYGKDINPQLNLTAKVLGLNLVDTLTEVMFDKVDKAKELSAQVQGAFVSIDNETGQIITMIGGKKFDPNHRFNYAMSSRTQPGSAIKPLYYSAAFDTKMFNPGSILVDAPTIFTFDSKDPDDWYTPYNYNGQYNGKVNIRKALRKSLNIPACKVFYAIGKNNHFRVPIDRCALLLGLSSQAEIDERFQYELSTALGTCAVAPIEMAEAYSIFANYGQRKIANCILYIEDRNGKIIYEPWKELQKYYRENVKKLQVISPETAWLMTNVLKETLSSADGTLAWARYQLTLQGKEFPKDVEIAGKTGSSQNWSDAWTVGYTPVLTTAAWLGFNQHGLSLGYEQPGAILIGPSWIEYMRQYHEGKGPLTFKKPDRVYGVQICRESGLLPSKYCKADTLYYEYFLPGAVPTQQCNYCQGDAYRTEQNLDKILDKYEKNYTDKNFQNLFNDKNVNVDNSILNQFKSLDKDFKTDDELTKIKLFDDKELINAASSSSQANISSSSNISNNPGNNNSNANITTTNSNTEATKDN